MNAPELPLERLNYFNGQRLEAGDFRSEQDYHMRVRRWLNKSLYTCGIAEGLDVKVKEGDPHTVVVYPGLALDPEGREIIIVEEQEVLVAGRPSVPGAPVLGNYLVIEYGEEKVASLEEVCSNGSGNGSLTWDGPSRIRLEPKLWVQNKWPKADSNKIVLAQLELDENCAVRDVHTSPRQLVSASKPAIVRPVALHGEVEIDMHNPKQVHFHIFGGLPTSVTLYIYAAQFPTYYYTEMGNHDHELEDLKSESTEAIPAHTHPLNEVVTSKDGTHVHDDVTVEGKVENPPARAIKLQGTSEGRFNLSDTKVDLDISGGSHTHTFPADAVTGSAGEIDSFSLTVTGTVSKTGQRKDIRISRDPLKHIADLKVLIDGIDKTQEILDRLGWTRLGSGKEGHNLVKRGTGPIRLDLLGVDLFEGEHDILFVVDGDGNGGRILYNLYVD